MYVYAHANLQHIGTGPTIIPAGKLRDVSKALYVAGAFWWRLAMRKRRVGCQLCHLGWNERPWTKGWVTSPAFFTKDWPRQLRWVTEDGRISNWASQRGLCETSIFGPSPVWKTVWKSNKWTELSLFQDDHRMINFILLCLAPEIKTHWGSEPIARFYVQDFHVIVCLSSSISISAWTVIGDDTKPSNDISTGEQGSRGSFSLRNNRTMPRLCARTRVCLMILRRSL